MARKYARYCASGNISVSELVAALASPKRALADFTPIGKAASERRVLCDTLDWRFDAQGWLMELRTANNATSAILTNSRKSTFVGSLPFMTLAPDNKVTCVPIAQINPESVRSRAADIALERAVIALCELQVSSIELCHYDREGRLDATVEVVRSPAFDETWISIFTDSWDESLHDRAATWFKGRIRNLWEVEEGHDYYDSALTNARRRRGDYAVKTSIAPKKGEHLTQSLAAFLTRSWSNFNLAYTITKLECDDESLHDLRVILRTTRAVLEPIVSIYKGGILKELLAETKSLAASTNRARDIDVVVAYLSDRHPEPELGELLFRLQAQVRGELRQAISADLSKLERLWQSAIAFLIAGSHGVYKKANRDDDFLHAKTAEFIKSAIEAQKLICQKGVIALAELDDPPPAKLHDLRKDFKRLRYLLESFDISRTPREERNISQAKNLQTQLGLFQDAEVRLEFVINLAADHHSELRTTLGPRLIAEAVVGHKEAQDNAVATLRALARTPGWKSGQGKQR